jgi:hypothetical protein
MGSGMAYKSKDDLKTWQAANREYLLAGKKEWYAANKDRMSTRKIDKYKNDKSNRLCTRCRKSPAIEGRGSCEPCRIDGLERHFKRVHGLTLKQRSDMFTEQGEKCLICGRGELEISDWHVDHDHQTGKLRGILCAGCNKGLGHFRDDPDVLVKAAEYVINMRGKINAA